MNIVLEHRGMNGGGVIRYAVVETVWGYAGIVGRGDLLLRVVLPEADEQSVICKLAGWTHLPTTSNSPLSPKAAWAKSPSTIRDDGFLPEVQQVLRDYFLGIYSSVPIRIGILWAGAFGQSVLKQLVRIRPGQTVTYGRLSSLAGRAGAARAVGSVMRRNPTPLLVPCHRVIRGDGHLGGYSAEGGTEVKKRLLDHERTMIAGQRTVTPANQVFSYVNGLQDILSDDSVEISEA